MSSDQEQQEQLARYYEFIAENMLVMRQMTEGNPRGIINMLAGDVHMGGPMPGVLDAIERGVLKEAGRWGSQSAERQKRIHAVMEEYREKAVQALEKEFGDQPSAAELAAEDCYNLRALFRGFLEDHFASEYRPFPQGQAAEAPPALGGQRDPMYG